ncbi:MAG: 23S rRNA (adenine(2503)-C(2))-methyltransferase RlmN [Acidobacteria bacterium]|nr:23S rRNA (adenine(2503)-C(2))-methyltransferase RlmN [Acidobacteriota bacterium]
MGLLNRELLGLELEELGLLVEDAGQPSYRARQLYRALYGEHVSGIGEISTLPLSFRLELGNRGIVVGLPEIANRFVSADRTVRYLLRLGDGETVETVWMPEGDSGESGDGSEAGSGAAAARGRATICVSSQAGCAVNCQFCLTALLGIKRNLTVGEIVGQVIAVLRDQGASQARERLNLVFMGMGEPFLNFENFMKAVKLLRGGVGIAASRMTVSTAGVVPRIYDLGKEPVRPKLAISLNAPNDELRTQLMPINRKWSLNQLLAAAREFPLRHRERLTFEYVLLKGVNDRIEEAREAVKRIQGIQAKVNLIALNPGPGVAFETPDEQAVLSFQKTLIDGGIPAFIRRPRGRDIYAACGQLKGTLARAT